MLPLGILGLKCIGPITGVILVLLFILYLSYRQTITAYPSGGGSYTVAKENLGIRFGLLAAAALMLDYTLTVAVGVSAGIGALISAVPSLHKHTLALCLGFLALITIVNLRGAREAGAIFALPTYLFVLSLSGVLVCGLFQTLTHGGHPHPVLAPPPVPRAVESVGLWLLLRSFASGCTAMTGVEAVSNGVTIFAKPIVRNAQNTLTAIVVILLVLLAGIAVLCRAYGIAAMDESQSNYQSVISLLLNAVVGHGGVYYITLASVLAVLILSANTSYAGFPRLCRLVALDGYLPHVFALLGRTSSRFSAARLRASRPAAGLHRRHLVFDRPVRGLADWVQGNHRRAHSPVCRRRISGVHAVAGGNGPALAAAGRRRHAE